MVKKIKCMKCKNGTVAYFDGKTMTVKRNDHSFVLAGDNWNSMLSCPRCGSLNSVSMTKNVEGKPELDTPSPVEEIDYTKMTEEKNNNNEDTNEEVKNEQGTNGEQNSENNGGQASNNGSENGGDSGSSAE